MDINIRNAAANDANDILLLVKEYKGENAATLLSITESLSNNNKEIVLIAYFEGIPAGFICAENVRNVCYQSNHGHIGELFVAEKYRKRGVGRSLMLAIEDLLKKEGIGVITLGTNIKNTTAQQFYEHCGYLRKDRIEYIKNI